jgi:hypothetical protein
MATQLKSLQRFSDATRDTADRALAISTSVRDETRASLQSLPDALSFSQKMDNVLTLIKDIQTSLPTPPEGIPQAFANTDATLTAALDDLGVPS